MYKQIGTLLMSLSMSLLAQPPINFIATDCTVQQKQVGLCEKLVKDLDTENALLKQKIDLLTTQRDANNTALEKATQPAIIPGWGWLLIGVAAGAGTYAIIRR